jgi:thiamine-monophosphate kinase
MKNDKLTDLGEQGIIALFEALSKSLPSFPQIVKGIGDDTAVLDMGNKYLLITTDVLIENIHFDWKWFNPFQLGYRCLAVNLSDIAAMGGEARYFLVSIGLPKKFLKESLKKLTTGIKNLAKRYSLSLIGGDTVAASKTIINITVIGQVDKDKILLRSGAQIGDTIFVSGHLGEAAAGLALLKKNLIARNPLFPKLASAQLLPEPELSLADCLANTKKVHAAIDISDGIAKDLNLLCEASGVGARIYQDLLPISKACYEAAHLLNEDPINWALQRGEDYRLLFTVPKDQAENVKKIVDMALNRKLYIIGEIINEGIYLDTEKLTIGGFDHFR